MNAQFRNLFDHGVAQTETSAPPHRTWVSSSTTICTAPSRAFAGESPRKLHACPHQS